MYACFFNQHQDTEGWYVQLGMYWYWLVLRMVIFRSSRKSSGAAPDSSENEVV